MGRNRFVRPQIVRLPLSEGDWIEVKRELNAGEQRVMFGSMVKGYSQVDGRAELDPKMVGRTKLSAYLTAWSLVDPQGNNVDLTEDAIDNLDVATYQEIVRVIDAHEASVEHEYEKNVSGGESKSAAISPSVEP